MSKFKSVLGNEVVSAIVVRAFHSFPHDRVLAGHMIASEVQGELLSTLHNQEPVAYIHRAALKNMHRDKKYNRESQRVNLKVEKTHDAEVPLYTYPKSDATGGSAERRARIMSAVESYADIAAMHMRGCGTVSESDLKEERKALELQISAELTVTMESAISSLEGWQLVPKEPTRAPKYY